MKKLILLTAVTVLFAGCMNIKDGATINTKRKVTKYFDNKTHRIESITETDITEQKKLTDDSFTLGTKGTGDYTLAKVSVQ